jgi:protease-4
LNRRPTLLGWALLAALALPASLRADDTKPKPEVPKPPVVPEITFKGTISEDPSPVGFEGNPISDNLQGLIDRISKAKADKDVKALIVKIRTLSIGWARANELREAIKTFRKSGKKVYAYLEEIDNKDYFVASAANEVIIPEGGWVMIKGMAAEVTFYKTLFDKLGVKADWMQVGKYKSYGEPFTRTTMSPAFREEMTELLGDTYSLLAETIADRKGISVEAAKALVDGGPYTPKGAFEAGLVTKVGYEDTIEHEIRKDLGVKEIKVDPKYGKVKEEVDYSGLAGFMKMMQALSGESAKKPESKLPKIAVIYASGAINSGKSSGGSLMGEQTMGAETVIKHLKQAETDKTVKAIVLRVDSPGGSALASDLIWREVTRIEKPIVASMGDVAASGGYYISMGADKVYAEPGTITGSIGVTGGKFVLGGLMDKLGVTTDTISIGKNGTIMSMTTPFSATEKAAMQKLMDETYKQFVGKAAEGRKKPYDDIEKHAGGRVYTGRQAKKLGLVDDLGTLADAIACAKGLGGISEDTKSELLILPKAQGVLESLLGPLEDRDVSTSIRLETLGLGGFAPEGVRAVVAKLNTLSHLLSKEPVVLVMPFQISIR